MRLHKRYLPPSRAVNEDGMRATAYGLASWVDLVPYPSSHKLVTVKIHIFVSWMQPIRISNWLQFRSG